VTILTGSLPFFAFTNNERPNNFRYRSLSKDPYQKSR
jgi:hypothetical protein